jgi:hypothetical protein
MRKSAGSALPGIQTGSTMRDVRPESDRAPADHVHHHPNVGRPAPEQRAVTPHRPANDGPPADDHYQAATSQPPEPPLAEPPAEPKAAEPPAAASAAAEPPAAAKPEATEPEATEPEATEPEAAKPEAAQPAAAEPPPAAPPRPQPSAAPAQPGADDEPKVGTIISPSPAAAPAARRAAASPPEPPPKAPSWPQVIATTLRLWFQRRGARWTGARRRALIFGAVVIVFAAGGLTFALAQGPRSAAKPRAPAPATLSPGAVAAAAANRQAAATWVAAQVSHSVIVSCDPVMCAALQGDRFPAGDLLQLTATANDPLGSAVVMSTTALRNQFGRRLPEVYAPVILATFGHGEARVDIRVEAPDGGRAYLVAQRADLLARQQTGQQLLDNKDLHVSAAAGAAIAAGNLDSRLLDTLATLTGQLHRVNVIAVGDSGPGASAGVPLRMVQISALVSPGHPTKNAAYLKAVLSFLKAQQPPFLASVSVLHQGAASVVQVQFAAPSPFGLLGAQSPP